MVEKPICSVCAGSPCGMMRVPEDGPYMCPECIRKRMESLEKAIDQLKGAPMIRGVESLGLEYRVTLGKWIVHEAGNSNATYQFDDVAEALLCWSDLHQKDQSLENTG